MMMTFLFIWTLQIMKRREPEPEIPFDTTAQRTTVAPTLSDEAREALPKEFLAAAETFQNTAEPTFVTLGSLAPDSPYRFLVTLTNRGLLARVESSEEAYIDYTDRTGYLGQIIVDESYAWNEFDLGLPGLRAQVVGDGTPAQRAGLKPNDRIVGFTDANGTSTEINEFTDLRNALLKTKPGDKVTLEIYEAERLEKDEDYRLAHLTLAKYMVNEEERRDDIGELRSLEAPESEEQDSASDESDTLLADGSDDQAKVDPQEESAAADDETALVASDVRLKGSEYRERLGAPKTLEVELSDTPLSILRPSGMVLITKIIQILSGSKAFITAITTRCISMNLAKDQAVATRRVAQAHQRTVVLFALSRVDDDMLDSWASGEGEAAVRTRAFPRARLRTWRRSTSQRILGLRRRRVERIDRSFQEDPSRSSA